MRYLIALLAASSLLAACTFESVPPDLEKVDTASDLGRLASEPRATSSTRLTASALSPPPVTPTSLPTDPPRRTSSPTPRAHVTGPTTLVFPPVAAIPAGLPPYNRQAWSHWADADGDCQNTRHEVLVAESLGPVTFKTSRQCAVLTGEWWAAFSNTTVTLASDLDVDHFVPLKNAHDSGGSWWDAERKQRYANSLEDPAHLIAVTDGLNQSKGSRGPHQWKPPNTAYWCTYATDWVRIKTTWDLTVTLEEATALREMLATCDATVSIIQGAAQESPVTPIPTPAGDNCDPAYPTVCIPPPPPDLDCGGISHRRFTVLRPDPHRFDGDKDGIGCES